METILLPFFDKANDAAWFNVIAPSLMASLIVVMCVGLVVKISQDIIRKMKSVIETVDSIKPKPKSLRNLAMAEEEADKELTHLSNDYGADRACIMLFHNGRHSLGNVDLLNASIKAEGGSGRFPRISNLIQSVPMSTYGRWTKEIITGHDIVAPDAPAAALNDAPDAYLLMEQNSVKSLYAFPVVTPTGDIDGCVFLEYCVNRRELGQGEMTAIRARGQSIYSKLHEANNV